MRKLLIPFLSILATGCDRKPPGGSPPSVPRALPAIQKIIADQLGRPVDDIRPDATFATLGADDLDLVEIVLATEETLDISINDDVLSKAAGASSPDKVVGNLTVQAFATFAEAAPRQQPAPPQNNEPNDGGLRSAQTGLYADLSQLPNPRGHELVFVPSLEELTRLSEQSAGRKLTSDEQAELKAKAMVIAMPPGDAEKLRQMRLKRSKAE